MLSSRICSRMFGLTIKQCPHQKKDVRKYASNPLKIKICNHFASQAKRTRVLVTSRVSVVSDRCLWNTWYTCFGSCRKAAFCVFFSFFKCTNKQENGWWSLFYKSQTCSRDLCYVCFFSQTGKFDCLLTFFQILFPPLSLIPEKCIIVFTLSWKWK